MLTIRQRQAEDVREFLRGRAASIETISQEIWLPKFSVKSRIEEYPEWFRETPTGEWTTR